MIYVQTFSCDSVAYKNCYLDSWLIKASCRRTSFSAWANPQKRPLVILCYQAQIWQDFRDNRAETGAFLSAFEVARSLEEDTLVQGKHFSENKNW